jgi:hypothetical protein
MFVTFFFTSFLLFSILGYSSFFKKFVFYKNNLVVKNIDFIYGYFFLTSISLLLNFFIPLRYISSIVLILGFISFIYFSYNKIYKINFFTLLVICFILILITHEQGIAYDSGLYHLQTIELNSNYKTILGIGNLQPHYGMNSSWHSFLSLINYNFLGANFLDMNFIYLGNISLFIFFINEIFKKDFFLNRKLSDIFLIFSILYIISYSYFHPYGNGTILNSLGSPETDTVAMIFFILTVYLFCLTLDGNDINNFYLFSILIFLVITIKISYIGIFLFFIYILFKEKKNYFLNKVIYLILFISFFWFLKSIFLTGCLIFPIELTCLKTGWAMKLDEVEGYRMIVQSFARDTPLRSMFTNFEFTLNSNKWILPWFKDYFLKTEFLLVSTIIIITNILIILIFYFFKKNINNFKTKKIDLLIITILFLNLLIWFRAPEIRFGYGSIISLVAFLSSIVILQIDLKFINKYLIYSVFLLIISSLVLKNKDNLHTFSNKSFFKNFDYSNFKVIYITNGYKVYMPTQDNFCNAFTGFCTYQGYKVTIKKKYNRLLIKKN